MPIFGVTSDGGMSRIPSESVTPLSSLVWTHAPVPTASACLWSRLGQPVFAGCCQPLLVSRTFPTLSLRICSDMPGPVPRLLVRCFYPFLLRRLRPSPHIYWVGSHTNRIATSLREFISGLQSFHHVQAPRFAHHPGRSYRSLLARLGSRDFYIRASHGSLPYRAPDMLVVRIGQLTTGDFHPIRLAALSAAPES